MRTFAEIVRPWASIGLMLLLVIVLTNRGQHGAGIWIPTGWRDWPERILITIAVASSIGFLCFMLVVLSLYFS
jgi:hypothetical protein